MFREVRPGADHTAAGILCFSLNAGVAVRANQRNKRERLCRTISRPALSAQPP